MDIALDFIRNYIPVGYLSSIVKEGEAEEVIGIMEVYPKYLFAELEALTFSYPYQIAS